MALISRGSFDTFGGMRLDPINFFFFYLRLYVNWFYCFCFEICFIYSVIHLETFRPSKTFIRFMAHRTAVFFDTSPLVFHSNGYENVTQLIFKLTTLQKSSYFDWDIIQKPRNYFSSTLNLVLQYKLIAVTSSATGNLFLNLNTYIRNWKRVLAIGLEQFYIPWNPKGQD